MVQPKTEPQDAVLPPADADANPTPKPPPTAAPGKTKDAKARSDALEQIAEYRRVTAWAIARWPLEKRVVHERVRVHLPRTYRARHGVDVRTVWPGTDLNQFVHQHYDEAVGGGRELESVREDARRKEKEGKRESERERAVREEWENFVAAEAILAKSAPCVLSTVSRSCCILWTSMPTTVSLSLPRSIPLLDPHYNALYIGRSICFAISGCSAARHEYLGPDPRVAGYWIDADGDYHIKWYDAFLKDQWVDNRKWTFDVRLNARGEWVEVDDPE
ncbi:hypothetical protein ACG7TL_001575 [Trametes sanguinea]